MKKFRKLSKTNVDFNESEGTKNLLAQAVMFRQFLRDWFLRERRDLPWRRERSVYRTVVSEFMLQQTQVDTVIPYFEKWTQRWKTFEELACAEESEVLRAWEGLGYYSRAKNLLAVAQRIKEENHIPATREEWQTFRGIGAYTAAAIASIAQDISAAVIDGNVVRILSRLSGNETLFRDASVAVHAFSVLAEELLDKENPGNHNEAMMELGAIICSRRSPRCLFCPVEKICNARARGIEELLPRFPAKKMKKVEIDRLWCCHGNEILLVQNALGNRRLKNLCEIPNADDFAISAKERSTWDVLFEGKRGIADEVITERFLRVPEKAVARIESVFSGTHASVFYASIDVLETLTFSGPHRKWLSFLLKKHLDRLR